MLFTRIISIYDAKKAVDFNVLLAIVAALGIAKAINNSGVAESVAHLLMHVFEPMGAIGIIAGLFLVTCIYTEMITNNAAAAIVFPFEISVATQMGIDPRDFILTITIAASSSFATPIGYQTNLMVYSPGGYKFSDYFKTGIAINILVGVVTTLLVYYLFFLTRPLRFLFCLSS